MRKIVLIENNQRVIDILTQELEHYFQATVVKATTYDAFGKILDNDLDIDLIITRNYISDDQIIDFPIASRVLNDVYDKSLKAKIIIMGEIESVGVEYYQLPDRFRLEELNRLIIKALDITQEELQYLKLPDYVPVPINNFYLIDTAKTDIYIKVSKSEGDQFIKRVHADDVIDQAMIKKYEEAKVRELFVKKEDHLNLLNEIILKSVLKIKKVREEKDDTLSVSAESFEISANLIETMGIAKHSVVLSKATIQSMIETIEDSPKLHSLMLDLLSKKGSYSYKRSYLINLYCFEVIPHMGWGTGDQLSSHFEKICWVSFFHDINLRDEDLLKISSNDELKNSNLNEADYTSVTQHANLTSTLVQSFPKTPQGIDVIIRQHHGVSNGIGFVDRFNVAISPMAILFIVVETFVSDLLDLSEKDLQNKDSIRQITIRLEKTFSTSSFKRVLQILRGLI